MENIYTPSPYIGPTSGQHELGGIGKVPDEAGYKNLCVTRDGMEAVISFMNCNVLLTKPHRAAPFRDFIEIERWLASSPNQFANAKED
jgi:hypothetical protein